MSNNVSSDKKFLKILEKNLMKILLGLWKYSAISKRFWVDTKEFPENYLRNFTLTSEKGQRILKN